MFWVGVCIGVGIGVGIMAVRVAKPNMAMLEIEREIAADNLKCAQEERRAAALRVIAQNERQAQRWSE